MQTTSSTRRKTKFNLDDGGSYDENFDFFTHKGKKLEDLDDFKDRISNDSGDQYDDKDMKKGIMTNDMVNALNFGGGEVWSEKEAENRKKTREERHAIQDKLDIGRKELDTKMKKSKKWDVKTAHTKIHYKDVLTFLQPFLDIRKNFSNNYNSTQIPD